jgi:hypothetical protein
MNGADSLAAVEDAEVVAAGVVGVLAFVGYRRRQARCSCGWRGPLRWLLPRTAAVDAFIHAANQGCAPALPLVMRVAPAGPWPERWRRSRGSAVMGARSKIEWTDSTWPVVTGCTAVSAGCDNCYAATHARRFAGTKAWPNGFDVTLWPDRLDQPMRWRAPRKVFVCSTGDLFHDKVPAASLCPRSAGAALGGAVMPSMSGSPPPAVVS